MNYQSREVNMATIFRLLKQKPGLLFTGILLTGLMVFIIVLLSIVISMINTDFKEIDHEKVSRHGKIGSAEITGIEEQTNVTVNNQHPFVIYYNYQVNDSIVSATFRTLESVKVNNLNSGDQIEIKYIGNESIITGLEPFSFPLEIVYLTIVPLLLIDIVVWVLLLYNVQKEVRLYKHGEVKNAELIAISPKSFSMFSGRAMLIHYKYETSSGQKTFGKSSTDDYTMINTTKPGDLIKIFVSSGDEQQSCLIPRLESEYNNWKIY